MLTPEVKAQKDARLIEAIRQGAAEFFERESNGKSLMTITRVLLSDDKKRARILFTVFPDSYESQALLFAKRNLRDCIIYLNTHTRFSRLPLLEFAIDEGEKNRQTIDMLLSKEHDSLDQTETA